jgi:hypothetical protein
MRLADVHQLGDAIFRRGSTPVADELEELGRDERDGLG